MTATVRRPGTTLMEVLLATFILVIGMAAIMALFPIGAVSMARAINQDRAATHAMNSDSMFRMYWKMAWVDRDPLTGAPTHSLCATNERAYENSQEPMLLLLSAHPTYGPMGENSNQAGYPVLVDPVGWQTKQGDLPNQGFVAGSPNAPVRTTLRRAISLPTQGFPRPVPYSGALWTPTPYPLYPPPNPPLVVNYNPLGYQAPYPQADLRPVVRLTTLLDEMNYDKSGEPAAPALELERGGRYTSAWLIQRPRVNVPTEVHLHVLVFAGRSPTDTPSAETAFPAVAKPVVPGGPPQEKTIAITLNGQAPPPLRKGAWIAFTMQIPPTSAGELIYPTLDFYRVVGVNDETPDTLIVEVESPIKQQTKLVPALLPPDGPYNGSVIVFDNLFEVYDRGLVTPITVTHK